MFKLSILLEEVLVDEEAPLRALGSGLVNVAQVLFFLIKMLLRFLFVTRLLILPARVKDLIFYTYSYVLQA